MEILDGPGIVAKPDVHYLGIRVVTPFRGMFAVRDKLMAELYDWLDGHGITGTGHTFFRLHVIDMAGPMDIELGVITERPHEGDDRVRPGVLPAGDYASLTYVNHARRANRTLVEWIRDQGFKADSWDIAEGEQFACRYEAYLTDPRTERMKTKWKVGLNIRVTR